MLASHTARSHLLPVMKRWLTAPRPDPSPAMWALRDLGIADEVAAEYLFWGLRHPEDSVKVNAALAIARRFAGQAHLAGRLAALAETGPSSATQAAAILALGNGWAGAAETARLTGWARRQPSVPLRLAGLDMLQRGNPAGGAALLRPEERAWLLSLLHHEDHFSGPWPAADLVNLAAAGDAQAADFVLETLATNGRNGGDRGLAWLLACNAFAGDGRFKAWVAAQLARPDQHGLILFNVGMIPQQWRDDPAFAQALRPYVDAELTGAMPYNVTGLATAMAPQDARAALLRGLDSGRPYSAAATLAERYLDDDQVREALTSRLRGDYAHAAPMAGVAIDVLGPGEGFAVLVSLLRQPDQAGRYEERVVVAQAVADAWQRFEDAARKQDAEAGPARDVLASYDPAELAALCTAVSPHPLMWHGPLRHQRLARAASGPEVRRRTHRRPGAYRFQYPGHHSPCDSPGIHREDRRAVGEDPRQDPQPAQAHRAGTPRGPGVRTRSQLAQRARPRRSHGGMEIRTRYRGSPHRLHRAHPGDHASSAGPRRRGRRSHRHPGDGMAAPGDQTRPVRLRT